MPVNGAVRSPALFGSECDTLEGSFRLLGTTAWAPGHDRTRRKGAKPQSHHARTNERALVPKVARTGQGARDTARNGRPRPFGYTGVSPQMVTRCMIRVCVG